MRDITNPKLLLLAMRKLCALATSLIAAGAAAASARAQEWTPPARLNGADDLPRRVTFPRLAGSQLGGFHAVYQAWDDTNAPRNEYLRYRRVLPTGAAVAPVTIQKPGTGANRPEVAESPNGHVHVMFESWTGGGPEVGWARSLDGGRTFSPGAEIGGTGRHAENLQVAGLGTGANPGAVVTWRNNTDNSIEYKSFNGSAWTGLAWSGEYASGLAAGGLARSPADGSVLKLIDAGTDVALRRFTGSSFGPRSAPVMTGVDQIDQPSLAVNDAGQAMVLVDHDYVAKAQLVNADGSRGPSHNDLFAGRRGFGTVTAIPGTNDFFAVATDATRAATNRSTHIFGRRFSGGQWGPIQTLATMTEPAELIQNLDVAADPWGNLMVAWQYNIINPNPQPGQTPWRPNAYYSLLLSAVPGDANADRRVNGADFTILARNFGRSGPTLGWPKGDFDFDGTVGSADFALLARNFGRSAAASAGEATAADWAALEAFAASHDLPVPEPGSAALIAAAGAGLLARRRRCR